MAERIAVKCKGCGCEVWVGSKIIDGYCHDCSARGRHLPPIVEDPPYQPQKKKPRPVTDQRPSSPERESNRVEFRESILSGLRIKSRHWSRWKLALILLAVVCIAFGLVYGVPALTGSRNVPGSEPDEIRMLRNMQYADFINDGERIPDEALPVNAEAIAAFISGGESYRMNGTFEYAYYDYADMGQLKKNRTEVDMSYNSDTDVYQFTLAGSGDISENLEDLGTYYIVKENGMTHILHDGDGRRTIIGIDEGVVFYEFLSQYLMENIVQTDFFTDADMVALNYGNGDSYSMPHDGFSNDTAVYGGQHQTELRTYQSKPIIWYDCNGDNETAFEWQVNVDFYYDNIPVDNPSVSNFN